MIHYVTQQPQNFKNSGNTIAATLWRHLSFILWLKSRDHMISPHYRIGRPRCTVGWFAAGSWVVLPLHLDLRSYSAPLPVPLTLSPVVHPNNSLRRLPSQRSRDAAGRKYSAGHSVFLLAGIAVTVQVLQKKASPRTLTSTSLFSFSDCIRCRSPHPRLLAAAPRDGMATFVFIRCRRWLSTVGVLVCPRSVLVLTSLPPWLPAAPDR